MSSGQAEIELEHLLKVEEKLHEILKKINQELAQNEVEYLHLKSLIEPYNEQYKQPLQESDVQSQTTEVKTTTTPQITTSSIKTEANFEPSSNADLDLRPFVKIFEDDVEYDTDLEDI